MARRAGEGRGQRLPDYLRPGEAAALLAAASTDRDRLIVLLGRHLGLRVSEICHLRIEHVFLDDWTLKVVQGKGKKDRVLPIPTVLRKPLQHWISSLLPDQAPAGRDPGPSSPFAPTQSGWMFPSPRKAGFPLTTRAIQDLIPRLAAAAGIHRFHVHPHTLRHTFGTERWRKTGDVLKVQRMMGHASADTTAIYTHSDVEDLRAGMED